MRDNATASPYLVTTTETDNSQVAKQKNHMITIGLDPYFPFDH